MHEASEKLNFWWRSKQIRTKHLVDLESMVDEMKDRYIGYCAFSDAIALNCNMDFKSDPTLMPLWEKWKTSHNALNAAYGVIRNDYRLNRLHHPGGRDEFGLPV